MRGKAGLTDDVSVEGCDSEVSVGVAGRGCEVKGCEVKGCEVKGCIEIVGVKFSS